MCAIADAVDNLKPLIEKNVTVAGYLNTANSLEIFMNVPIGTRVGDLIDMAGGLFNYIEYPQIRLGAPLTGTRTTLDLPPRPGPRGILVTQPLPKDAKQ